MDAVNSIAGTGDVLNISFVSQIPDLLLQLLGAEAVAEMFKALKEATRKVSTGPPSCLDAKLVPVIHAFGLHGMLCLVCQPSCGASHAQATHTLVGSKDHGILTGTACCALPCNSHQQQQTAVQLWHHNRL